MTATQLEFQTRRAGQSQNDLVLELLQQRAGQWVAMPELEAFSGSHRLNSRASDLRRRGFQIENKTEFSNGSCRSFYRLTNP